MSSDGVERRAHAPHRRDEIGEAFEREVFAVQRDQHAVGGDERVEREQAERRRRIDDDEIESSRSGARRFFRRRSRSATLINSISAPERSRVAGIEREPIDRGRQDEIVDVGVVAGERFVDRAAGRALALVSDAARGIALRVAVDEQHLAAVDGERGGQVDRGGGLADAAFLIRDGDNFRHINSLAVIIC